ncbi:MAG: DUF4340 domain-containing protein [Oscillospiraceae bacterium]|nr:DUF4340 domain-containing protein [Oscillospiraceae bacterium]
MKRAKKLIILACVLALIIVLAVVADSVMNREETPPENDDPVVPVASADALTAISWQFDGGRISLEKKPGGEWFYPDDPAFPLDQSFPETMLSELEGLTASRQFENAAGGSEYGFDSPMCVISTTAQNGEVTVLNIGNQSSVSKDYYLTVGNVADVFFMVKESLISAFPFNLLDLVAFDIVEPMDTIIAITVRSDNKMIDLIFSKEIDEENDWFLIAGEDKYLPLSSTEMSKLKTSLYSLKFDSCVNYNPSAADLSEYGLDKPSYLTVKYTPHSSEDEITVKFLFGKSDGDKTYAQLDGSIKVYLIDTKLAESIKSADYHTLKPETGEDEI